MERLQAPPIRTPLEEGNGSTKSTAGNTAKEWYLYWRQAGEQVNAHADSIAGLDTAVEGITGELEELTKNLDGIIRYGVHADRLAIQPDPLDALWVETDRQNIVYQARVVAGAAKWVYVTGAMHGTVVAVDQRPTDLGANDTGLIFLSSDSVSVRWTGSAWEPLDYLASHAVLGAAALTHPNVVTKVGPAGAIGEGGITDESAANSGSVHVSAIGDVGIGNTGEPPFPYTGYRHFTVGTITPDVLQPTINLAGNSSSNFGMALNFTNYALAGDKRVAMILATTAFGPSSGDISFYTWNFGSVGQRMFISPAGNVGIGVGAPGFQLQLSADSAAKPATSTWAVVSDLRLKQNIEPVTDDSLAILGKLDWVRYEYNGAAQMPKGQKAIGLAAQALREQLPEAVRAVKTKLNETDAAETEVLGIDYHHILVHSARAIRQLHAEVKRLSALIEKPA